MRFGYGVNEYLIVVHLNTDKVLTNNYEIISYEYSRKKGILLNALRFCRTIK